MTNSKITSIGEILIDWACLKKTLDLNKADEFIKAPGGAPANVAVALAKLEYPVQFVGGFSPDLFGDWLKHYLLEFNVDVSNSVTVPKSNTRNAYVMTDENGNRTFKGFTLNCCADSMLDIKDINMNAIASSPIVYFGSLLQATSITRNTIGCILDFVNQQKYRNLKLYDPNLRLSIWSSVEEAVAVVRQTFEKIDILKLSDDEIGLFSSAKGIEAAAQDIFDSYENIKLLVITLGKDGSYYLNKNGSGFVKSFKVASVEMTGAGDGFVAGLLGGLYDYIEPSITSEDALPALIEKLTPAELDKILHRANAIGALATTKPGAMTALPTKDELKDFLSAKC